MLDPNRLSMETNAEEGGDRSRRQTAIKETEEGGDIAVGRASVVTSDCLMARPELS